MKKKTIDSIFAIGLCIFLAAVYIAFKNMKPSNFKKIITINEFGENQYATIFLQDKEKFKTGDSVTVVEILTKDSSGKRKYCEYVIEKQYINQKIDSMLKQKYVEIAIKKRTVYTTD